MIKRLIAVLVFALLPASVWAQATDRDTLVTPDGTLYSVESESADASVPDVPRDCGRFLVLTTQDGDTTSKTTIPESLSTGVHWRPALAYDADSKSLFVFWLHSINASASELLFSSLRNGKWSAVTHFEDDSAYRLRSNLRIAVTRKLSETADDGQFTTHPGLTVHAVWWEQRGDGESAQYAMLTIENGEVTSIVVRHLLDFFPYARVEGAIDLPADFDREVFRHPAIVESPTHDSVDVVFADWEKNHYNRLTLRPIANARPHVPVGIRGQSYGPPQSFRVSGESTSPFTTVNTLFDPASSDLIMYYQTRDAIRYEINRTGEWSTAKSIVLSDQITADVATSALRKLIATQ